MNGRSRARGVVLIVVLWVIALLMLLLAAFSATVRVDKSISGDMVQRVQGRASAEAALAYLASIQRMGSQDWPKMPGRVFILPFEGVNVRFRLIPEEAYISLKGASPEILTQVIGAVAGGGVDVAPIVERIIQRRDGTTEPQAETGGEPTLPPAPLRAVEELGLIPGVNRAWLDVLLPMLTLDSEHAGIAPKFAPVPVLRALLGDDKTRSLIAARGADDFDPSSFIDPSLVTEGGSEIYRVQVEVGQGQTRRRVEVTCQFGEGPSGYKILRWNEYTARFDLDLP